MSMFAEKFFDGQSPIALVFGGASFIGSRLCEEFLEKNIRVISIDDSENFPKENISGIKSNSQFVSVNLKNFEDFSEEISRVNYVVDVCSLGEKYTKLLLDLAEKFSARYLYLSTFLGEESEYNFVHTNKQEENFLGILKSESLKQKINFRVVRLGDAYGPRMILVEGNPLSCLVSGYAKEGKIKVPRDEVYVYPLFVDDAVWGIVKTLLSPGTKGSTISLSADRSTLSEVASVIKSLKSSIPIEYINQDKFPNRQKFLGEGVLREGRELVNWEPHTTPTEGLANTLEWLDKNKQHLDFSPVAKKEAVSVEKIVPQKHVKTYTAFWQNGLSKEKEAHSPKKTKKEAERKINKDTFIKPLLAGLFLLIVFVSWFLVFPFVELFFGLVNLQVAQGKVNKKDLRQAETWANISSFWLKNSQESFLRWSIFPPLRVTSATMAQKSRVLDRIVDIVKEKRDIRESIDFLFEKILGDDSYSIAPLASLLSVQSSSLDQSLAFLATEIQDNKNLSNLVTKRLGDSNLQLSNLRGQARTMSGLAVNLDDLLGYKTRKSYLILIQDNTQARPAGGVVLGYGILTFDKGRLISGEFFKASIADDQLKGKVDPPGPLAKYTNQKTWTLKDVSWDQDFSLVAKKAIWFADKELDQKIDGVISTDLDFLSDVVKEVGPITTGGTSVDSKNLYKLVLSKGDEEKQAIVVDVFNQIYDSLVKSPSKVGDLLWAISLENLAQKHVMLYVNDIQTQNTLTESGWGGSTKPTTCPEKESCFSDFVNFVDANLGEGSANYYLKRSFSLDVFMQNGKVLRKLTVFYKNSSKNDYKNYFKVLVPSGVSNPQAFLVDQKKGLQENVTLDLENQKSKTLFGGYIVIPGGEERQVMVSWESGQDAQPSIYMLLWQKQPGSSKEAFWLTVNNPKASLKEAIPIPSLTGSGSVGYNGTLAKDLSLVIKWQK
ncbi:MAG: DUF4012 domain-containing protein [Candidatus Blackburnbacteria bacterium]|nr:DUF4012 domain-containing protein [Candidatus Blackburnbacteria bacterium]